MKSAKCCQQLSCSSVTRYQAGTWAPFLFQTTTIRRWRGQDWKSNTAGHNRMGHYVGFDENGKTNEKYWKDGRHSARKGVFLAPEMVGQFSGERDRRTAGNDTRSGGSDRQRTTQLSQTRQQHGREKWTEHDRSSGDTRQRDLRKNPGQRVVDPVAGETSNENDFQDVLQNLDRIDSHIARTPHYMNPMQSWKTSAVKYARTHFGRDIRESSPSERNIQDRDDGDRDVRGRDIRARDLRDRDVRGRDIRDRDVRHISQNASNSLRSSRYQPADRYSPSTAYGNGRDRRYNSFDEGAAKDAEDSQKVKPPKKNLPVPFAHMMETEGPEEDPDAQLQGTTMSRSELNMFEKLLALQDPEHNKANISKDGTKEKTLNEKVAAAVGVKIVSPQDKSNEPIKVIREHKRKPQTPAEQKYEGIVRRAVSLMKDAQTDSRLWAILHEEAFAPLIALDLDGKMAEEQKDSKSKAEDQKMLDEIVSPSPSSQRNAQKDAQEEKDRAADKQNKLQTLAYTLPRLLTAFYAVTNRSFKNSSYQLAVLPYLKSLGPASFALGVTTDLYNQYLGVQYRNALDLQGILDTLNDMHRQVVSYDSRTLDTISRIVRRADEYNKSYLDPMQAVWGGAQKETFIEPLREWAVRIQESLNEDALDAMATGVGEDDGGDAGLADADGEDAVVEDEETSVANVRFA